MQSKRTESCKIEQINVHTKKIENLENERLQSISAKKSESTNSRSSTRSTLPDQHEDNTKEVAAKVDNTIEGTDKKIDRPIEGKKMAERLQRISAKKSESANSRSSTRSTLTDQHEEDTKEVVAKVDNTIEGTNQDIDRPIEGEKVTKYQSKERNKRFLKKLGIPKSYVEVTSYANEVTSNAIYHLSTNQHTKKYDGHKRVASDTSILTTLNLLQENNNNSMRIGWNNIMSNEREEALESLLELCAELLKHKKLEELVGVLKPFGEEVVSSRETTIWLTKGLMNLQNPGEEA